MINSVAPEAIATEQRANLIYATARADSDTRLWRAALGEHSSDPVTAAAAAGAPKMGLDALLALLQAGSGPATLPVAAAPALTRATPAALATGLGANIRYSDDINAAAKRTGVPASALVAIIGAESAKTRDGTWRTDARNPRSTATGIGQFLAGTWQSEAERAGTWLNRTAHEQGWIGSDGVVLPAARSALLALRHDGEASINATADYARRSLDRLTSAGVVIGNSVTAIADAAYIGHNLGFSDALKYLRGGLGETRAKLLLEAQVGPARAGARVADAGSAVAAHRQWLGDFIARHVKVVENQA